MTVPREAKQQDPEKIASDWIAYARLGPKQAPETLFADGWVLVDLARGDPATAWAAIKAVVASYSEEELYSCDETEAQRVVGLLAAGPLEDILGAHGARVIGAVETEARRDRRMAWTLGGVWRSTMSDDIWARVQHAADYSYWKRPSSG